MTYPLQLTLTNPGFEAGSLTGWTATNGFAGAFTSGSADFFAAQAGSFLGAMGKAPVAQFYQDFALDSELLADVDAGSLKIGGLAAYHRTYSAQDDHGALFVSFLNGSGVEVGYAQSAPDFSKGSWGAVSLADHPVPSLTRTIRVGAIGVRMQGDDLDSYWDGFSSPALDLNDVTVEPFSYELGFTSASWTNDTATVSAVAGAHGTTVTTWAHAISGACHKDVTLPSGSLAAIDAGEAGIFASALQNSAQLGRDMGRFSIAFLDGADAAIGGPVYSSAAAFIGKPVGTQKAIEAAIPANARKVRVSLIGVRDPTGDDLVTGFNRVFLAITNAPGGGGVTVFLSDALGADLTLVPALTAAMGASLRGDLALEGSPGLDPPFQCAPPAPKSWTSVGAESPVWLAARAPSPLWVCAEEALLETGDILAFVDGAILADLAGDHLKLIG